MTHSSSSDEDDRPSAKRTKVFRACAQCVTAKQRCEDVKSKGCWLCRRRRKDCSLAGAVSESASPLPPSQAPHATRKRQKSRSDRGGLLRRDSGLASDPSTRALLSDGPLAFMGLDNERMGMDMMGYPGDRAAPPVLGEDGRMVAAEYRISALERELQELRALLPNRSRPSSLGGHSTRQQNGHSYLLERTHTSEPEAKPTDQAQSSLLDVFSQTIFAFAPLDSFPSVIAAGILTSGEVDLAFQPFKHHFSSVLPLSPFLSIGTPTPSHNFVILACLHHVPTCPHSQLVELVNRSIIVAISGRPSVEVVLAFLILALAPELPPGAGEAGRPSPLRLISLAYQLGRDLGLDSKVQGYIERGGDLAEPFWAEPMQLVQLWTAVVNRYIILQLLHGHGQSLPSSPAPLIPSSPNPTVQYTTNHLVDECRLAEAARRAMTPLVEMAAGLLEHDDVKRSMQEFNVGMEVLIGWQRDGGSVSLDLDQRCLEHTAASRLGFLLKRIPSPLASIQQTVMAGMAVFIRNAERLLTTLFPNPHSPSLRYAHHLIRPAALRPSSDDPNPPIDPADAPAAAPPPIFPAHVSICATLAMISMRMAVAHKRRSQDPYDSRIFQRDRIVRAEAYIRSLSGRSEVALAQADAKFGTFEEIMDAWAEEDRARLANSLAAPPESGAPGGQDGMGMASGEQIWETGENAFTASGLFDFDLFAWDPNFLAQDWMSAAAPGGVQDLRPAVGPTIGVNGGSGMAGVSGNGMMGSMGPALGQNGLGGAGLYWM